MATPDLTVRGAGIFGLSIAWAAARRGAIVRVVETASVGAGASGGVVGAMAPHVPEAWNDKKAFQLHSLLMAQDWWAAVEAAGGVLSGYARLGRLQPLANAAAVEVASQRAKNAETLWRGQAVWRVVRAAGAGWEPVSVSGWLVEDTLSARIAPRQALRALVAALKVRGGQVVSDDAAEIGPVIWATGVPGLQALSQAAGRMVGAGQKGQAALLALDMPHAPQVFAEGVHIVPHGDGTVAIGSTTEREWQDPAGTDTALDDLIATARALCPLLMGARVVERWAGLRPRASTRAPLIGAWPGRAGHFIANGGFKIGFGMAPGVAEAMVDLVLDGRDSIPEAFRPDALF